MIGTLVLGVLAWVAVIGWYFWPAYGPKLRARYDQFDERRLVRRMDADPYKIRRLSPEIGSGQDLAEEHASECGCCDSGVILVEGPCDAAPQEAPCSCLTRRSREAAR